MQILKNRGVFIALLLVGLLLPLFTDSQPVLLLFTRIFILAIFAMSYDILLGYTGIISFGHVMYFGIGAYSISLLLKHGGESWVNVLLAALIAVILSAIVSLIVGILSLRLKNTYYAMITLAFAELFHIVSLKWRSLTYGEDGFNFSSQIPDFLKDRFYFYYISFIALLLVGYFLYQFTKSPTGKVLVAIRENEARAEMLGFSTLYYKLISSTVAGVVASLSGILYAISYRYVGSASVFGMDKTIDALLMTIIGGVGTLFGAIIGAGIINLAHQFLADLANFHPIFERWLIFFGILYILIVMFFPSGILGTFNKYKYKFQSRKVERDKSHANSS